MPNFNPFSNDTEDTSFEQGRPVSQAAKNATKAVSAKIQDDNAANKKAILDQLYGPKASSLQDQKGDTTTNKAGAYIDTTTGMQAALNKASDSNQTPEDQAKIAKVRSALFGNYSGKFQSAPNAAHGLITNIDQEMEKARQERKQKEQERKEAEEREKEQAEQEKKEQQQELAMPAGKKTGVQMGKKQQQPMAVHLANIKTEGNRGTSG